MDNYTKNKIKNLLWDDTKWKKGIYSEAYNELLYIIGGFLSDNYFTGLSSDNPIREDFYSYNCIDILNIAIQKKRIDFIKFYFDHQKEKYKEKNGEERDYNTMQKYYNKKFKEILLPKDDDDKDEDDNDKDDKDEDDEDEKKKIKLSQISFFKDINIEKEDSPTVNDKYRFNILYDKNYSLIMNYPLIQAVKVRNNHEIIQILLANGFKNNIIFRFDFNKKQYSYFIWHFCLFYNENIKSLFCISDNFWTKLLGNPKLQYIKYKQYELREIFEDDFDKKIFTPSYLKIFKENELQTIILLHSKLLKEIVEELYENEHSEFNNEKVWYKSFTIDEKTKENIIKMIYLNGNIDAIKEINKYEKDLDYIFEYDLLDILIKTNNNLAIQYLLNNKIKTNKICTNFTNKNYKKIYSFGKDYLIVENPFICSNTFITKYKTRLVGLDNYPLYSLEDFCLIYNLNEEVKDNLYKLFEWFIGSNTQTIYQKTSNNSSETQFQPSYNNSSDTQDQNGGGEEYLVSFNFDLINNAIYEYKEDKDNYMINYLLIGYIISNIVSEICIKDTIETYYFYNPEELNKTNLYYDFDTENTILVLNKDTSKICKDPSDDTKYTIKVNKNLPGLQYEDYTFLPLNSDLKSNSEFEYLGVDNKVDINQILELLNNLKFNDDSNPDFDSKLDFNYYFNIIDEWIRK